MTDQTDNEVTQVEIETLEGLIGRATDSDLSDSGRYFAETCFNFTECDHGDCGEYTGGSADGKLVQWLWNNRVRIAANLSSHRSQQAAPEVVEAANRLIAAVEALPVEDMVEADRDGDPMLVGYAMQAQGEWDEARRAKDALTKALATLTAPPQPSADVGRKVRDLLVRIAAEDHHYTLRPALETLSKQAREILASLPTQPDVREADWRPIETFDEPSALSSGNGVLITAADGTVGEAYYRNFDDTNDGWWWANTSWGDYPEPERPDAIFWRPLPDPAIRKEPEAQGDGS